jgi:uncharacterized membrane protein YccC
VNAQTTQPEARSEPGPGITYDRSLGFALRTTLAGIAALFVAMWLQIDTPRWAIWTVFIVSPPVRGNALRKTAARISRQTDSLRELLKSQPAQAPAMGETLHAPLYLLSSLQTLLTFKPPDVKTPLYSPPKSMARPPAATINMIRAIVGMFAGFLIWDLTAWPQGPAFMVIIAVVVVVLVKVDDPIVAIWAAVVGSTAGGVFPFAKSTSLECLSIRRSLHWSSAYWSFASRELY